MRKCLVTLTAEWYRLYSLCKSSPHNRPKHHHPGTIFPCRFRDTKQYPAGYSTAAKSFHYAVRRIAAIIRLCRATVIVLFRPHNHFTGFGSCIADLCSLIVARRKLSATATRTSLLPPENGDAALG